MKALNFGSLNLDYVYRVPHFVRPGETLSALEQTVKPGGKGLNQSVALARAGAEVWHAGCLGQGGDMLRELLRENGVQDEYLLPAEELQGNAVIQVNPQGENCILLFGGSNRCVTSEQIEQTLAAFGPGDWLILQNEVNRIPEMVEAARAKGMTVVLNPSPFNDALSGVDYDRVSWLLMNEIETEQLTGEADPEKAWAALHARHPRLSVLVTLGSAGSLAWQVREDGVEHARQEAFPVRAVDTTAAGDTYTGYFVAGLMEGRPLRECMRRASRASAIAVTRPGAAESVPFRAEVEAE